MELPKRKNLRLSEYDYGRVGAYFVTLCTHNRQNLFGKIVDSNTVGATLCGRPKAVEIAKRWINEIERKFISVKIDEFVIMPDHIHLIIIITGAHAGAPLRGKSEDNPDLKEIMEWYKTMTTNEYIREVKSGNLHHFNKHVWQRSYFEHVIRNKEDLREIQNYIRNNPISWISKHIKD